MNMFFMQMDFGEDFILVVAVGSGGGRLLRRRRKGQCWRGLAWGNRGRLVYRSPAL